MEEYKIINGLRHYRLNPTESWRVDNRTNEEVYSHTNSTQAQVRGTPVYPNPARPYYRGKRKKKSSPGRKILVAILLVGIIAGVFYNHFNTSEEESIIEQYLEKIQNVEGEEANE